MVSKTAMQSNNSNFDQYSTVQLKELVANIVWVYLFYVPQKYPKLQLQEAENLFWTWLAQTTQIRLDRLKKNIKSLSKDEYLKIIAATYEYYQKHKDKAVFF